MSHLRTQNPFQLLKFETRYLQRQLIMTKLMLKQYGGSMLIKYLNQLNHMKLQSIIKKLFKDWNKRSKKELPYEKKNLKRPKNETKLKLIQECQKNKFKRQKRERGENLRNDYKRLKFCPKSENIKLMASNSLSNELWNTKRN